MIDLESSDPEVITNLAFLTKSEQYLNRLLDNIHSRFQNTNTVTLLSLIDPRNCESTAKTESLMELGRLFDMDGPCK